MAEEKAPQFRVLSDEQQDGDRWLPADPQGRYLRSAQSRLPDWLRQGARRRRWRWSAAVAVAALVIGIGLLRQHSAVTAQRSADARAGASLLPVSSPRPVLGSPHASPSSTALPWPKAPGACGGDWQLPQVSADPLREHTGVRLLASDGNSVRAVDLDSASVAGTPSLDVPADHFVSQLVAGGSPARPDLYALVSACDEQIGQATVMHFGPGATPRVASHDLGIDELFADGTGGVWAAQLPNSSSSSADSVSGPIRMRRLDRPASVTLPARMGPVAVFGNLLVGLVGPADPNSQQLAVLSLVDLRTGAVTRTLGPARGVTVGAGLLMWTSAPCPGSGNCAVHRYDLATGTQSVHGYPLPAEADLWGGAISPDRSRLAFSLPRKVADPRWDAGSPGTPSDLVVLDLVSGLLERVPDLELPPKSSAALLFSADSRWLVIGLNEGSSARLLVWRSGQSRAQYSPADLHGALAGAPELQLRTAG